MSKGGGSQTVTQRPDGASQQYIDQNRNLGAYAAGVAGGRGGRGGPVPTNPYAGDDGFLGGLRAALWDRVNAGSVNAAKARRAGAAAAPESLFAGPLSAAEINAAMSPYTQNVIDATRGEFDHLRSMASKNADQQATQASAFGGSRHAIMEGARLGEVDRAQASTIAGLHQQGYGQALQLAEHNRQLRERQMQEPLFRAQQAINMMNLGMGPVGTTTTQRATSGSNPIGSAASGALTGFSVGGPWGAAIGGGLGLLSGAFDG